MFDKLKTFFRKDSKTGQVILTGAQTAQWMKREYASFADEGYRKNVVAYQAINKTAQAVASIPWIARRPNGEELVNHPLLDLLANPNPLQSGGEFLEALVGFYRIAGNGYIERVMVGKQPRELYALRPDRMTVLPGVTVPTGYKYTVNGSEVEWLTDNISGDCDIRHMKTFHPLDDWYGLSPIEAGAYSVDQHNEASKYIMALLQHSATPSGAIELDSAEAALSDEAHNRLKSDINEQMSGARNAGRPLLLHKMKWTQMGMTPQAMGIIETRYASARDVSLALGVPPLLLNIPGDSTYSNYKEARLAFYEETVIPLAFRIRDELNSWLAPLFDGVMLDFDLDQVPTIAEKRQTLWDMANQATDLTINERREMRGYEPIKEGGDTVYISQGMIPVSFDLGDPEGDPDEAGREAYGNTDGE